jgi:hypothetical protein
MAIGKMLVTAALGASCCAPGAALSAPTDSSAVLYPLLTPPSALEVGCQGPCACPVADLPVWGSFELVPAGRDPLFTYYDVQRFIGSFWNGPGAVGVVGSGHYRMGGEVALQQQMTLDLQIEGQPLQHFDSGLVPVGAAFPGISISCAVHAFACFDSVMVIEAAPATAGALGRETATVALERTQPNPFRSSVRIAFRMGRAGPVELAVYDVTGGRVRVLAGGEVLPAGEREVAWDGRREDGEPAPAGVYWVRLRSLDGTDQRRFSKLE